MRRNINEVREELERRRIAYERQRRARRRRLLYTVPIVLVALVLMTALLPWGELISPPSPPESPYHSGPSDPPKSTDPQEPQASRPPDDPASPSDPLHGSASYRGGVDSFEELLEVAELIAVGTVVSTDALSPLTETATVRIEAVWRAPEGVPSEIALYQMKDSHTASVGCRYLLFLMAQTEGETDAFYSIGGGQGTLLYDAESGRVSGFGVIDGEAATRFLADNDPISGGSP